jgi:hypothetical protein
MSVDTENGQIAIPSQLGGLLVLRAPRPCGSHFIKYMLNRKKFFYRYTEFLYPTTWHIPILAPFPDTKRGSVTHSLDYGQECPFGYVYNKAEARQILSSFREATMRVAHSH